MGKDGAPDPIERMDTVGDGSRDAAVLFLADKESSIRGVLCRSGDISILSLLLVEEPGFPTCSEGPDIVGLTLIANVKRGVYRFRLT